MGKKHAAQQLVLEEYQEPEPVATIIIDAHQDTMIGDDDMGSLPGCIGYYDQPGTGFVCSSCYHQELCKTTAPTPATGHHKRLTNLTK